MIRLHYTKARKHAYPYGVAKIAGPFETWGEAHAGVDRLRQFYPNCAVYAEVDVVSNAKGALILGGPKIEERTTVLC